VTEALHLLTDPSPCLRFRVLTELIGLPQTDTEVRELRAQRRHDPLYRSVTNPPGEFSIRSAIADLRKLALLGFDKRSKAVRERAAYLFSQQREDGSWPISYGGTDDTAERRSYSMIPLQTALPLIGLSASGYAEDPRAEAGYDWLESKRLDDGAWPTGISSGVFGHVASYRRLPHSRWGCRSNTTGALMAFSNHPARAVSEAAKKAVDHLLSREKFESANLGFETARGIGAEKTKGFFTFFARSDPGSLLEISLKAGVSRSEPRVEKLIGFVYAERTGSGLWRYQKMPQVSRWVTYQLLKTLKIFTDDGDLYGDEPPTPFTNYPRRLRRW
jgi:hypothetical protein